MTLSESDMSCDDDHSWKTGREFEQTSEESQSSSAGSISSEPFADAALDNPCSKLPAMNLVLKTRISSRKNSDACDLQQKDTKSTMRTSFTTSSTNEFGVKSSLVEEVTVTDDGPVEHADLKEDEVYQRLSELKIVPLPQNAVPEFVSTPKLDKTATKTTPSTSACTSPSQATNESLGVPVVTQSFFPQEDDSSDSDISDISGLTGAFTNRKSAVAYKEDGNVDAFSVAAIPEELSGSTASPQPSVDPLRYPEEMVKTRLLQQAATSAAARRKRAPKSVSFSTVSIREYQRILGDNPSCSCGPSISIGWDFDTEDCFSVNEWESWRCEERDATLLVLCREEREDLLLDLGYNHKVIAQAVRDIIKVKNKRRQTIHNLEAMGVEEMMESASKKLKSVRKRGIFGKRKKKNKYDNDDESLSA